MASNLTLQRRSQRAAEDSAAFGPVAERFRRAGDLDRAVALCREGLQKFPNHVSARVTLGWSLLDLGKYDEARVELESVLRRAPDNLAAIRGLAELHDRAEHTLSLPMDGPGQWPPTEDAVNEAAATEYEPEIVHVPTPEAFEAAEEFAGESVIEEEAPVEQMAVFTAESVAEPAFEEPQIEEPQIAPVAPEESEFEEPEIVARAVDVEPFDVGSDVEVAIEPDVVAQEQAAAAAFAAPYAAPVGEAVAEEFTPKADLVSEDAIAALLAEAEKLEAAAVSEDAVEAIAETPDEPVEFGGEPMGNIELAVGELGELNELVEPIAAEAVAEEVVEPVTEVEAVAEEVVEPVAEVETVADEVTEPVAEVEAVAEEVVEPVAIETIAEAIAEAPIEVESDVVVDAVAAFVGTEIAAVHHTAEIVQMARPVRIDPNAKTIAALERFLGKVQSRRRELMRQSVA